MKYRIEMPKLSLHSGLNRDILKISLPAILNNITVPLLGLNDTAISGHLGNIDFVGAVAIGAMMLNMVFWLFGFLRMGTAGLTANAFGAANYRESVMVLARSLFVALLSSAFILFTQSLILRFALGYVGAEGNLGDLASSYFRICIYGVPAQMIVLVASGWFVGMQNTFIPMIVAMSVNVINILLSLSLVFLFRLGFVGIPYGTMASNWIGAAAILIAIRIFLSKYKKTNTSAQPLPRLDFKEVIYDIFVKEQFKNYFKVNSDLFLRSACVMAVSVTMTAVGSRLGAVTLAVNAIFMQFFLFFSYFMDGFAFAGEALCGRFRGAGNIDMLHSTVHHLLRWGAALALIFFTIYLFGYLPITRLLTDSADIAATIPQYRVWIWLLPPLTVMAFIYDGIYIGVTLTRQMLIATFLSALLFIAILALPSAEVGRLIIPKNSLLLSAFETYLLGRGLILAILSSKVYKTV